MESMFAAVLRMSLEASVAILVVLAVRLVLRRKLPAVCFCLLWAVVLVRLVLPVSLPSPTSIFNLVPQETRTALNQSIGATPQTPGENLLGASAGAPTGEAAQGVQQVQFSGTQSPYQGGTQQPGTPGGGSGSPTETPTGVGGWVGPFLAWSWFAGAVGMFLFFLALYFRARGRFATAVRFDSRGVLKECAQALGMRRRVGVYLSDRTDTPVVCGLLRPRIILPYAFKDLDDRRQLRLILTHELVHIRRGDHLFKPLFLAALCLHWFNPLVWVAARFLDRDLERSCDERVVSLWGEENRGAYASSLLDLSVRQNGLGGILDGGLMAFGETGIKERVRGILAYRKPALGLTALGMAAVLVLTACLGTGPSNSGKTPKPGEDLTTLTGTQITDPARLEGIWNDYLYFCITGLQRDFTDPAQVDLWGLVSYVCDQFSAHGDVQALEQVEALDEDGNLQTYYLWPYEQVNAYLQRYFDLTVEDFSGMETRNRYGPYVGQEQGGLLLPLDWQERYRGIEGAYEGPEVWGAPEYRPVNSWGMFLEKALEREDGSVVVVLSSYMDEEAKIISTQRYYLLEPREEEAGTYWISACQYHYLNNHLADLSGTYTTLTTMEDGGMGAIGDITGVVGEDNESFTTYTTALSEDQTQRLISFKRVSKQNGAVLQSGEFALRYDSEVGGFAYKVRPVSDGYLVMGIDEVIHVDKDLAQIGDPVPVPQVIRSSVYGMEYDVAEDFATWYVSTEEGLWRYDAASGTRTVLVEPEYGTGRLMEGAIIVPRSIRLVDGDQKLLYLLYGYEWISGAYSLDLTDGTMDEVPFSSLNALVEGYGSGQFAQMGYGEEDPKVAYYDYASGETRIASLAAGVGSYEDTRAVGRNASALGVSVPAENGDGVGVGRIYRYWHGSGILEELDFQISLKNTYFSVLAVFDDGRVLVRYSVNEAEGGLILVG